MELTDSSFWDDYWAGCRIPVAIDYADPFDRCLAAALKQGLAGCKGSVLEVGCAPGRWLAYMASDLGLKPSGIEYSEAGMNVTVKNLAALGVDFGEILDGDFFKIEPSARFDAVISLGFIEHFNDADAVMARHLAWLRPGGTLVIGVPNFRGVYGLLQRVLDRSILDKHNLGIMTLDWFRGAAARHGLEVRSLGYIGSFEPALPVPPGKALGPLQFIVKTGLRVLRRIRRLRLFDGMNSRFFSSYILMVSVKRRDS